MTAPRIPLAIPCLGGNESRYVQECITTNFVSSVGPFVTRFESLVAEAAGTAFAVATSSGTTALHLALTTVGVAPGELVILPTFTFIASANAIAHCGAQPWLVDVERDSWTVDVGALAQLLARETLPSDRGPVHRASGRRVAALLPVYTLGTPARMAELRELASRHRIPIVADAAAAIGATLGGAPPARLAELSVYSFNGNKTITTGGGGMVVGDDPDLLRRARHLSTTARVGREYHHDAVGWNYRMTNLQAALGCAQMEQLGNFLVAKRRIRDRYDAAIAELPGATAFPRPAWSESACWFSGAILESAAAVASACAFLDEEGIEARPFWKPVHLQPPYRDAPAAPTPVADEVWARVLTLPCSTSLSDGEQRRVIDALRRERAR